MSNDSKVTLTSSNGVKFEFSYNQMLLILQRLRGTSDEDLNHNERIELRMLTLQFQAFCQTMFRSPAKLEEANAS